MLYSGNLVHYYHTIKHITLLKKKGQQHRQLATKYFRCKFSNRLATNYIYTNFLILATDLATENRLLKNKLIY